MISSRTLLSKLIIDQNGIIQLYNSSTASVFGLSKFYIEDSNVTTLKKLLTDEYFQSFNDLPNDSYFLKNRNKVIGPVKVINGRNEKDIQTKISLISMSTKKEDFFDKIYLLECWIPDVYMQLLIASPKEKTQSMRNIEVEDDYSMQLGFHLVKRVFTLGKISEQVKVDYENYAFVTRLQSATMHKTGGKDKEYGDNVKIKYLTPLGHIIDRAPWMRTEEDEEELIEKKEEKHQIDQPQSSPDDYNDKKDKSSFSELSVISGAVSDDIFKNIRQKRPSKKFQYSSYLLLGNHVFIQHTLYAWQR